QNSLLNVGLDINDVPYREGCAASILEVVKKEVPRFGDVIDLAIEIMDRADWSDDEDSFFTSRLDKLEGLTCALAGDQGVHMRRWKSFKLALPEDEDDFVFGRIWPFHSDSMPRLELFTLRNYVSADSFGFDLSNVRHLALDYTHQFHWASFSRHLLTTAVVGCCSSPSDLRIFSGCGALQELTIADAEQFWVSGPQATMAVDVELPSLKKLTLGGRVIALRFVTFKSPCLDSLTLLCGCAEGIPKVRARLVEWIPDGVENLESTVEFLRYLFGEVREMEELVFRCEEAEMVSIAGCANLDAFEDPNTNIFFVSSQSSGTVQTDDVIALIEDFQQSILDLSRSLADTIRQYSNLVTSGMCSAKQTPSLPNETMVEIFQHLVADGSHHLKPLLLVNKWFHALVTSAPNLWCNIHLNFDAILQERNNLSVRYVRSCMKHSQTSPLNIDLDFTAVVTDPLLFAVSVLEVVKKKVPQFEDVIELVRNLVSELDWVDNEVLFTRRLDKLDVLRRALAGKNGIYVRRWRSCRISSEVDYGYGFDEDEDKGSGVGARLWPLFKYSMPNLDTLVLNHRAFEKLASLGVDIPDLTAIRHLTLNMTSEFRLAPFSRDLLMTATVGWFQCGDSLEVFSGCRALRQLTIISIEGSFSPFWDEEPELVELPSLRELTLGGG
ncbi:hypothetical protein FRC17_005808, partial [Serendipita sp. 399]